MVQQSQNRAAVILSLLHFYFTITIAALSAMYSLTMSLQPDMAHKEKTVPERKLLNNQLT